MIITAIAIFLAWDIFCFVQAEQWRRELAAAHQRKAVST